ncbi:MAG: thiamine phosphate synthase [Intestinibacillus sp.]
MSEIICVTHRRLCPDDFLTRMRRIVAAHPRAVILREKDLTAPEYEALARQLLPLCRAEGVPLLLNGHPLAAAKLGCGAHLPFMRREELLCGGISVHTPEEARGARQSAARYLIAGHIWDTGCKAGLAGRGTDFLREVVQSAEGLPVYAIGGVTPERMPAVLAAGAAGACVMSSLMTHPDPAAYLAALSRV